MSDAMEQPKPRMYPETLRGLELIEQGVPLRRAAEMAGVSTSTLTRARLKLGAEPLPKGRPVKAE